MALSYLRLRRALSLSSTLIRPLNSTSSSSTLSSSTVKTQNPSLILIQHHGQFPFQSRSFRSSSILHSSKPRQPYNDGEKIDPDAILFEGCDYNHWLITMDFPKNPKPTPEQMVETYVQTAAKVVGSVEEAKKRIYSCSTSTYDGFNIEVSEEMSQKFEGLPGVVFVLPDSYIDPVNKEYGGDKYINGTIIPRPPPVQYGRTGGGGRYGDGNRGFNRTRDTYQQGGDTRNFGAQQNNNNFPPRTAERRDGLPMNNNNYNNSNVSGGRGDYQSNSGQGDRGNNYPQGQRDFPPGPQRNYSPPQTGNYGQGPAGGNYGQGPAGGNYGQGAAGANYGQGAAGANYGQGAAGGNYGQGVTGGNFGQGAGGGNYGQGAGGGNYGQRAGGGSYGQGAGGYRGQGAGGNFGQESGGNYGQGAGRPQGQSIGSQGDFGHGENQGFSNIPRTG